MIDGIANRPLYFYQKDIIGYNNDITTVLVPLLMNAAQWFGFLDH